MNDGRSPANCAQSRRPLRITDGRGCPFCGSTPHIQTCRLSGRRLRLSPAVGLAAPPLVDTRVRQAFAGSR